MAGTVERINKLITVRAAKMRYSYDIQNIMYNVLCIIQNIMMYIQYEHFFLSLRHWLLWLPRFQKKKIKDDFHKAIFFIYFP